MTPRRILLSMHLHRSKKARAQNIQARPRPKDLAMLLTHCNLDNIFFQTFVPRGTHFRSFVHSNFRSPCFDSDPHQINGRRAANFFRKTFVRKMFVRKKYSSKTCVLKRSLPNNVLQKCLFEKSLS
jgi:hypothetical protein